jgi:endogenous inhibitor of DNA gyrase (YacG/DUF329 family)
MQCPICKKPVTNRDDEAHPNPHYPFCSDRCQLIDLGRWLDGKYQIRVRNEPDDEADKDDHSR